MSSTIAVHVGLLLVSCGFDASPETAGDATLPDRLKAVVGDLASDERRVLAFDGYCPVTLKQRKQWKPGDADVQVVHRGNVFCFASAMEKSAFERDPDRYSPVFSGVDVYVLLTQGKVVLGRREHGVFYKGRTFLFASEASLEAFVQDADAYVALVKLVVPETRFE